MLDNFTSRFKKIFSHVKKRLTKLGGYMTKKSDQDLKRGDLLFTPNDGTIHIFDEYNSNYDLKELYEVWNRGGEFKDVIHKSHFIKIEKENVELGNIKCMEYYEKKYFIDVIVKDKNGKGYTLFTFNIEKGVTPRDILNRTWSYLEGIRSDFVEKESSANKKIKMEKVGEEIVKSKDLKVGDMFIFKTTVMPVGIAQIIEDTGSHFKANAYKNIIDKGYQSKEIYFLKSDLDDYDIKKFTNDDIRIKIINFDNVDWVVPYIHINERMDFNLGRYELVKNLTPIDVIKKAYDYAGFEYPQDTEKKAENISFNPAVNTNTSPERQRRFDWITVEDRNKNKQKTKRWDRQTMPEDSGGGYDMTNRFEDADKVSITPVAELKPSEFNLSDIVITKNGSFGKVIFVSQLGDEIKIMSYGKRTFSLSPEDIFKKINKDDMEFEIKGLEFGVRFLAYANGYNNKYMLIDSGMVKAGETIEDLKNRVWEIFINLLSGMLPPNENIIQNAKINIIGNQEFQVGDIVFIDKFNELGIVKKISPNFHNVKTLLGRYRDIDDESLEMLSKVLPQHIDFKLEKQENLNPDTGESQEFYWAYPIVRDTVIYGFGTEVRDDDTQESLTKRIWNDIVYSFELQSLKEKKSSNCGKYIFKKAERKDQTGQNKADIINKFFSDTALKYFKKSAAGEEEKKDLKVGDIIISYSIAPFIGEVTDVGDKEFQVYMIFEGGNTNANNFDNDSLYEIINKNDISFDIVEDRPGEYFARPIIKKGNFEWSSSYSEFAVEIKEDMTQDDIVDKFLENIFCGKELFGKLKTAEHDAMGMLAGAYMKTAEYDNATIQTSSLPENVENQIKEIQKNIKPEQLTKEEDEKGWVEDGLQKMMHITILYGINEKDLDKAKEICSKHKKIEVTADEIEYFRTNDKYDVAVVRCESKDLEKLHYDLKKNLENQHRFKKYKPHITIAYIKKGEEIEGDFEPFDFTIDKIEASVKGGKEFVELVN